jgi:hypothetical protein
VYSSGEHGFPGVICAFGIVSGEDDPPYGGTYCMDQSPHFALASEMLERVRSSEAKYVSMNGALLIRVRLAGD